MTEEDASELRVLVLVRSRPKCQRQRPDPATINHKITGTHQDDGCSAYYGFIVYETNCASDFVSDFVAPVRTLKLERKKGEMSRWTANRSKSADRFAIAPLES